MEAICVSANKISVSSSAQNEFVKGAVRFFAYCYFFYYFFNKFERSPKKL